LLTPAGVLPLGFEIDAGTLEEALKKFPDGVKVALEQAIDEARELRREAASRIVVPGSEAAGAGRRAASGGGKIKFPSETLRWRAAVAAVMGRARPALWSRAREPAGRSRPVRECPGGKTHCAPPPRLR